MKLISILFVAFASLISLPAHAVQWPNGAKSAVSMTSDDGWPSQLTQAQILENYGFRGTFYLSATALPVVETQKDLWRGVFQRGHEVGNHGYYHWTYPVLETKTWQQVANDISTMEYWLLINIYSNTPADHTFAYPGGNYSIGPQDTAQSRQVGSCEYVSVLTGMVSAARSAGSGRVDPNTLFERRYFIGGLPLDGDDAQVIADAKAAIDRGIADGTWTVLVFHSLGDQGDGLAVTENAYTQIVDYLYQRRMDLWVAPLVTVKNHILSNTPTANWTCVLP